MQTLPHTEKMPSRASFISLADWLRQATPEQREQLARTANVRVNYLYKVAGGHSFASELIAYKIEMATKFMAMDQCGPNGFVLRQSMVRHPEVFTGLAR